LRDHGVARLDAGVETRESQPAFKRAAVMQ
jgi:hypothetical protein